MTKQISRVHYAISGNHRRGFLDVQPVLDNGEADTSETLRLCPLR